MTQRLISTFLASPQLVYSAAEIQETGCPISVISSRSSNHLELRSQTSSCHNQDQGYQLFMENAIEFNITVFTMNLSGKKSISSAGAMGTPSSLATITASLMNRYIAIQVLIIIIRQGRSNSLNEIYYPHWTVHLL